MSAYREAEERHRLIAQRYQAKAAALEQDLDENGDKLRPGWMIILFIGAIIAAVLRFMAHH